MKNILRSILPALVAVATFATTVHANDTITINWTNSTGFGMGRDFTAAYNACNGGTCTIPHDINSGTTGVLTHTAASTQYIRTIYARYYYIDNLVRKSCQLQVTAYGPDSVNPGPGCQGDPTVSFLKGSGTGSSPSCGTISVQKNNFTCTYVVNVITSN